MIGGHAPGNMESESAACITSGEEKEEGGVFTAGGVYLSFLHQAR